MKDPEKEQLLKEVSQFKQIAELQKAMIMIALKAMVPEENHTTLGEVIDSLCQVERMGGHLEGLMMATEDDEKVFASFEAMIEGIEKKKTEEQ